MADEQDKQKRSNKLLGRLKEQGDFQPDVDESEEDGPSVNPFTLSDIEAVDLPESMPDLEKSDAAEVVEYLQRLDTKMRAATTDFAAGRINQAQFQAIYTRYREQREIIERMQKRNPDSKAWQRVATEGYTEFLLNQFEAKVVGLAVFSNMTGGLIKRMGQFDVPVEIMLSMLDTFASTEDGAEQTRMTQIEDGRWLGMVSGKHSSSVILYSTEPPKVVIGEVTLLHRDFERVNEEHLTEKEPNTTVMVFPQKRLFTG